MTKNAVRSMEKDMSDDIQVEIDTLLGALKSVQLATLNTEQQADISYAPYLKFENHYYVFISELATHTQNLKNNPALSLMFIADESASKTVFARKRLILRCESQFIARDDKHWENILDAFEQRQGNTIKLLKTLPDFCLFQIKTLEGSFVKGFGQAFTLSGENLKLIQEKSG